MTGPISEVPGFHRPEPREEPERAPRPSPLISAVPGFDPVERGGAAPEREAADAPLPPPPPPPPPARDPDPERGPGLADAPQPEAQAEPEVAEVPQPEVEAAPEPEAVVATPAEPEALVAAPPEPEAVTPPAPEVGLWGAPDEDALEEDVDATRVVQRSAMLVLRWDDGTVLELNVPTVVGRDPVGDGGETAVALEDSTMSLSKTHARFVPGLAPTVEDLHSTNGVSIARDGVPVAVGPGQPAALRHGDEVICGTRRASVEVRA